MHRQLRDKQKELKEKEKRAVSTEKDINGHSIQEIFQKSQKNAKMF
jgi:hypothetical protein